MRKTILLHAFLCTFLLSHAQSPHIPVDPLTGRLDLSIAIGRASEGNLVLPVSISYAGGGVRVEQGEGTAGMGWHVAAGGAITRQVRGLPDDYTGTGSNPRRGWLYESLAQTINNFTPAADENYLTCADEESDYNFLLGLYDNIHDTEPDIFNFNAPGLSGQFVFGPDGLPKLIPFQDLIITVSTSPLGDISLIKIKNNLGITYWFDVTEIGTRSTGAGGGNNYLKSMSRYFGSSVIFNYAWHLSKITSEKGAEITITYTTPEEQSQSKDFIVTVDESNAMDTIYSMEDRVWLKFVSQINTDASDINFTWEDGRIKQIDIVDNETTQLKSHTFTYEYVKDYRETGSGIKKAFLKEIYQSGNCNSFPAYSFTYDQVDFVNKTTQLPFKERNYQDLWGYYNSSSVDEIPDIHVYNSHADGERFRINSIPGEASSQHLVGSSRYVNASAITAGSLQRITYPSGAAAVIDYEPNSYFDATANATYQGSGIRVQQVTISGMAKGSENMVTEYEYLKEDGQSSGKLLYPPVFAFAVGDKIIRSYKNLAPDGGVLYSRATVKQTGKGKTVYEFLNPAVYPSTSESGWSASKNRIARYLKPQEPGEPTPPCVSPGNQLTGYYLFPFAPNMNFDFERGLPDRITDYAENGTPVQEREYAYQTISSDAANIKGLKYELLDSNFVYSIYTLSSGVSKTILTETLRRADDLSPSDWAETSSTYTYSSVHQMLESVSTTNSDGVIYKTRYRYAKDFSSLTDPDPAKPEAVALKILNDSRQHGEVIETIQTRNAGSGENVTGANLLLFKDFGSSKVFPHRSLVFPAVTGFTEAFITGSPQTVSYDTDYMPVVTHESYTSTGLIQNASDHRKNKSGVHYGYNGSIPVVSIGNAYAEEVAASDFESETGFEFSVSGPSTAVQGWTGNFALSIEAATVLSKQNIKKGASRYRYSCWVNSATAVQLTFAAKNGSVVQASGAVSYSSGALGQWQYLESEIDMSPVSDPFTLEVTATTASTIDDIRFYPEGASLKTSTCNPLHGITSVTDDRGISSFTEYDGLGRVKYVRDRFRNILQVNDYRYKNEIPAVLVAAFTGTIPQGGIIKNDPIVFTATGNTCLTGLSYEWFVSDGTTETLTGTGSTLNFTFTSAGYYTVRLRVESSEGYWDETFADYCVMSGSASTTGNTAVYVDEPYEDCPHDYTEFYECESGVDNYVRTLNAKLPTGCLNLQDILFKWYYRFAGMNDWVEIYGLYEDDGKKLTFNLYDYQAPESFEIKVVITGNCTDGLYPCYDSVPFTSEKITSFTYIDGLPCQ